MTVEQLYTTAARLRRLHSIEKLSWREIAAMDEFSGISHSTLRDIANGHEPSAATCRALGVRKSDRYRLHYECGRGESGRERDAQIRDEMRMVGADSFTDYVDKMRSLLGLLIVDGDDLDDWLENREVNDG